MYTPDTAIFMLFQSCEPTCTQSMFIHIWYLIHGFLAALFILLCATVSAFSLQLQLHDHLPASPSRTPRHGHTATPTTNAHYLGANYWHYSTGRFIIHWEGYFQQCPDDLHDPNVCLHVNVRLRLPAFYSASKTLTQKPHTHVFPSHMVVIV
jgi:hypothetical protein